MKPVIKESATSLTALVFFVVGTSGVLLYFHLFEAQVKELHETLGLVFVAAAFAHVFFNRKGMKRYFPKKLFLGYAAAVTAATLVFVVPAEEAPNPKRTIIEKTLNAPLAIALPLLETDTKRAGEVLAGRGLDMAGASTLSEVARRNGISPFALVGMLTE